MYVAPSDAVLANGLHEDKVGQYPRLRRVVGGAAIGSAVLSYWPPTYIAAQPPTVA